MLKQFSILFLVGAAYIMDYGFKSQDEFFVFFGAAIWLIWGAFAGQSIEAEKHKKS